MTFDDDLISVLDERAGDRPDPDEVLAGLRDRIEQPSRRLNTRTLAMTGSIAAVAAVAVVGTALAGSGGSPHGAAGGGSGGSPASSVPPTPTLSEPPSTPPTPSLSTSPPSASPSESISASAPLPSTPVTNGSAAPSEVPVARTPSRDYVTIAAGWLPGPAKQVEAANYGDFEQRDYTADVGGTDMDVIIWLERDTTLPTHTEAGSSYRSLTINGHPAREFVAGVATIIAVDLGHGVIAFAGPSVVATTPAVPTSRITAIAEHVLRSVEYGRHDPIPGR